MRTTAGGHPPIAERVVDELLDDPATATWAGDHRADDRLPDWSADAVWARVIRLREAARALAQVDPEVLDPPDAVDLELLRAAVDARLFALTETRDHEWDPLVHNPGFLLHKLLVRPAPAADRLVPLIGRLEALPDALAVAEAVLTDCPTVHLETAVGQAAGAATLVRDQVGGLAETEPGLRRRAEAACIAATAALERHEAWLRARVERPGRDPRLGRALWEAKLGHTLDGELDAAELMSRAEARLDVVWQRLTDAARVMGFPGPRAALDALAADAPDDATIVAAARHALAETTAFVAEHDLVPMLDDPVEVVRMPEFARGIAVAYCDAPGPLEAAGVPTFYAISPTPAGWSAERVASFYREYNHAQLRDLTVHEAMPGHYLQLAHERRFTGSSRARAVCTSGAFREGWAVYCEEMMADHGFGGPPLRLQQLKLQLRMTINTILDQLVHCAGLTEADGMALMTGRGLQEEARHEIVDFERERREEVPMAALREAVVNALVHRDYTIPGPTRIFVLSDRVEVHSPGRPPNSVDADAMRAGVHVTRNPHIYSRMAEAQLAPRAGTGIRRIARLLREAYDAELGIVISDAEVVLLLPRSFGARSG